jgi:hypothetical protein
MQHDLGKNPNISSNLFRLLFIVSKNRTLYAIRVFTEIMHASTQGLNYKTKKPKFYYNIYDLYCLTFCQLKSTFIKNIMQPLRMHM